MREDYKFKYKSCDVSCTVYEDNSKWGGSCTVTIHAEDTIELQINLSKPYSSIKDAKDILENEVKSIIDCKITS